MSNKKAFTLLEVIISVAILAFISVFTATSIQNAIKYKAKTINKIEESSQVQDALKIMAEDIRLAFNHKDINIELFNLAQDERKKRAEKKKNKKENKNKDSKEGNTAETGDSDKNKETQPDPQEVAGDDKKQKVYEKKEEKRFTHFLGKNERLDFTCTCNTRSLENAPFSNLAEVGYFIEDCRGRLDKRKRSSCLWRRLSPIIDDELDDGGTKRVLLENLESLKFRYIGPESEEDWRRTWMTDENGDAITKNIFPYAVEITIEMEPKKEKAKKVAMTIVAPLSFPNHQKTTQERLNEQKKAEEEKQ